MPSSKAALLTDLMLSVFRVNGRLLERGDRLVGGLNLTSARWQILGAIALVPQPATAPRIAAFMGITRQGAQKQLNLLLDQGLIQCRANPANERSPLYALSAEGEAVYAETERLCGLWCDDLAQAFEAGELRTAGRVLERLLSQLDRPLPTAG